ncbi:hypothetical protein P152DRAFT_234160 [Eremomyces bilateralis CBS 781.70]|uniref:Uncharacterized protein n=1 Tax=Eremomyces bilateralis CBS 781.70 TaxID=1392243 RepID=A0A6G1G9V5_9PEZI|nr:uncharacterized protein P152DRAFT_234160 [Eremomyces bilateralis CBS 781.70]KAF1814813.1 hypothetical protein P152DRAFT_234160 [Eremomyces bilateralis CBS 781.70]
MQVRTATRREKSHRSHHLPNDTGQYELARARPPPHSSVGRFRRGNSSAYSLQESQYCRCVESREISHSLDWTQWIYALVTGESGMGFARLPTLSRSLATVDDPEYSTDNNESSNQRSMHQEMITTHSLYRAVIVVLHSRAVEPSLTYLMGQADVNPWTMIDGHHTRCLAHPPEISTVVWNICLQPTVQGSFVNIL